MKKYKLYLKFSHSDFEECRLLGYCAVWFFNNRRFHHASIFRVTRTGELVTTLAVSSKIRTLRKNTKYLDAKFLRNVDSYKRQTA
jgi:hypothetical protein